jgi:hypothetical protein
VLILSLSNIVTAQSGNKNPNKAWSLNANLGPSFLYGDMSDNAGPFEKLFSDEFSMSYGILARKGLSNVFGLNAQVILGNTSGYRDYWSTGAPTGGFHFKNFYTEFNLHLDIDIMNIFNAKDRRLINPYLKGGFGLTYHNTDVIYKGVDYISTKKSSAVLPFGGGIRFDISPRLGITLDQAVSYLFSDDFDGYDSKWTDHNDWYTYTSIGLTYRFVSKKEKKKYQYDEEDIPEENVYAYDNDTSETEEAAPKAEFQISADLPKEIYQGDTFVVVIKVSKGDYLINGPAKIQQTLPANFVATEGESHDANFLYANNIITFEWREIPQAKNFTINYKVTTMKVAPGDYLIPGIAYYTQDSTDMVRQFRNDIHVKSLAEKGQMMVVTKESKLLYRVQVVAIYGGKTSIEDIKKRYGISEDVHVDYEGGYTKYTVGGFKTYEEARIYRDKLRQSTASGAFIVGYYDDSRINDIKQAIEIEKAGAEVMVVEAASELKSNDIYKIQIAASTINRSAFQIQSKYGIKDKVSKSFIGGLYKYTVGNYTSYSEAKRKLEEIRKNVPDAFIVISEGR